MEVFLKVIAGTFIVLILYLILARMGKEFPFLLTVAACCMLAGIAVSFLSPIYHFIDEIIQLGSFDSGLVEIVFKTVGIGLLTEVMALICSDAGNSALGKILQILASVMILWMSLPLFTSLITLAKEILIAL